MRKTLKVGMLSAGIVLIGSAPAMATENWSSTGNTGLLNGNQVYVPAQVPVNVCGLAIGILGDATAGCEGGAKAVYNGGSDQNLVSAGNIGLGNGNQVIAKGQAPINVCGLAISVLGSASAGCQGGSEAVIEPPDGGGNGPGYGDNHGPVRTLPARDGHKAGNAHKAKAPKTKVVKKSESLGSLVTGLLGVQSSDADVARHGGGGAGGSCDLNWMSTGNIGLLNGNQVYAPIQAPIDVSGSAITVGGTAMAHSKGGVSATYC
jgi:hypothetical protein